jgi:hypothetical protein
VTRAAAEREAVRVVLAPYRGIYTTRTSVQAPKWTGLILMSHLMHPTAMLAVEGLGMRFDAMSIAAGAPSRAPRSAGNDPVPEETGAGRRPRACLFRSGGLGG